jgi:hypothetical protein
VYGWRRQRHLPRQVGVGYAAISLQDAQNRLVNLVQFNHRVTILTPDRLSVNGYLVAA